MKLSRRLLVFSVICLLVCSAVLPISAAARNLNTDAQCTLTISYHYDGKSLSGAVFHIYRVADVDENGVPGLLDNFTDYGVEVSGGNASDLQTAAQTLLGYVQRDGVTPDRTLTVGEDGLAVAENLPVGMYLVEGGRLSVEGGTYSAVPMLVTLPVAEMEEGQWNYLLKISPKPYFEPERETLERKVLKVWDDAGRESDRPQSIEVTLLCDGVAYEKVTLTAENNWRYSWSELDAAHQWTIVESAVEGYTATHSIEGITTVITNTPVPEETEPATEPSTEPDTEPTQPPKPEEPELPQTGMLWWPIPVLAVLGLVLMIIGVVMKRGAEDES